MKSLLLYFLSYFATPPVVPVTPSIAVDHKLECKCKGAILGAAIGDALGRITEFLDTTDEIKYYYDSQGLTSLDQFKKTDWINGKALYTDDTVMAKILLEDALHAKKNNLCPNTLISNYAHHCIDLLGDKKWIIDPYYAYRAHGPTNEIACQKMQTALTKKTILQIIDALTPDTTHFDPQINKEGGCGSVMRVWPLGLVFYDDIPLIAELAQKQSIITHRHPMARAACVAMAVGTACAVQGMSVDEVVNQMISTAKAFDAEEKLYKPNAAPLASKAQYDSSLIAKNTLLTSDMIAYAYQMALQGKSPELILGTHNLKQTNYRSPQGFLLGWAADEAVAAAVYIFTRHSQDIKAAIVEGVNTPGDSDSIATLAAALVGAHSGITTLDTINYSKLENKDELLKLAKITAEIA